jgi:CRISPR/Cas system-associated exonuclease Cas4 (RecB family)
MPLPDDFIFTQNNLQDFIDCPRRFQLRHLLKMSWPAPVSEPIEENDRLILLGTQFHKMVHQYYLGIPEEKITRCIQNMDLNEWWQAFRQNPPQGIPGKLRPEIEVSMPFEGYRLAAKIDLLAVEKGTRAVIVDWKTTHRPPGQAFLRDRVQSLVYPYLVITTGTILNDYRPFDPSQVSMIYWFPAYPDQTVTLRFDQDWVEKTSRFLTNLVQEISRMDREIFPLTVDEKKCQFCRFRSLCERGTVAGSLTDEADDSPEEDSFPDIDFSEIEGISF